MRNSIKFYVTQDLKNNNTHVKCSAINKFSSHFFKCISLAPSYISKQMFILICNTFITLLKQDYHIQR